MSTPFTELFAVEHPIALAPMGGSAGGALAAAVSNGGGLGLVGGGRGDWAWLEGELALTVDGTDKPWGVGFLSWSADVSVVERAQASVEALVAPEVAKAIIDGRGEDTERSRVLDIARGAPWPERYTARTLRNAFLDRWRGREDQLQADEDAKAEYSNAADQGDLSTIPVWASEAIDLITDLTPAADLVAVIATEAHQAMLHAGQNPDSQSISLTRRAESRG